MSDPIPSVSQCNEFLRQHKVRGKSMLKAEGKGKDGSSYRAELTKAGDAPGKQP